VTPATSGGGGYSWDKRRAENEGAAGGGGGKKKNPEDFIYRGLRDQTVVRPAGTVAGEQLVIEDCHDCTLVILDRSACVTVDDCTGCTLFLGPVEGSVFVRDCEELRGSFVCRQFRCRELHASDLRLFCATRPIIESSRGLRLACLSLDYAGLAEQLEAAGLSPLRNFWSAVYDFTPPSSGQGPGPQGHWDFLPAGPREPGGPPAGGADPNSPAGWGLPADAAPAPARPSFVPTRGDRPGPAGEERRLVLLDAARAGGALDLAAKLAQSCTLVHANLAPVPGGLLGRLAAASGASSKALSKGPVASLELAPAPGQGAKALRPSTFFQIFFRFASLDARLFAGVALP
jgi:protein XRP2